MRAPEPISTRPSSRHCSSCEGSKSSVTLTSAHASAVAPRASAAAISAAVIFLKSDICKV